ncbi:MAG: HAD-IG family 5'-nucleotidase [Pseudobdellovibrionaceae bacterium]
MPNRVYVNRTLNLKKITHIGFDMDHTLIRYKSENFELLSHQTIVKKLIQNKNYPKTLNDLKFDFNLAVRGLVIDRFKGNLLKLNRYGAIRAAFHGIKPLDFKTQRQIYSSTYIDLSSSNYLAIDTTFSISNAVLFAQIVTLKEEDTANKYPDFAQIADDVLGMLDEAHRDGSLKNEVKKNLDQYIIKDESVVRGLERFLKHGKKLFVLTNSDYAYSKLLMDYAINPFLKDHKHWSDLFEYIITLSQKPKFFYQKQSFLKVDPSTGAMTNFDEKLKPGIYQGGCATKFTEDLDLQGDDILYIGDHIYGDILRLKKDCNWRTALVIEELKEEIESDAKAVPLVQEINRLMQEKEPLEEEMTKILTDRIDFPETAPAKKSDTRADDLQSKISAIDHEISQMIKKQLSLYNSSWGQLMRTGNEESYFAYQLERYACVYMAKISNLLMYSPRTYFRAPRRPLSHEIL